MNARNVDIQAFRPGKPMTVIALFDQNGESVLMCDHKKQHGSNFVGGKVENGDTPEQAALRELAKETGVTAKNLKNGRLQLTRHELTNSAAMGDFELYVYCGQLEGEVQLREETNSLYWTNGPHLIQNAFGWDCWVYLNESAELLGLNKRMGLVRPEWLRHLTGQI